MGGTPCVIIIIGNETAGGLNGIGNLFAAGYATQPKLTADEKKKLVKSLVNIKSASSALVNEVRQGGDADVDISTLAMQAVGNFNALCISADSDDVDADTKETVLQFIAEKRTEVEDWLKFLRERAIKETV